MKLEFLKPWRCHRPGKVAEIPDGVAGELLKRNWARRVPEPEPDPAIRPPRKKVSDGLR